GGSGNDLTVTPAIGSISGLVFADGPGSDVWTAADQGLAGVSVYLDANNNGRLDPGEMTTTTDSSGAYAFANLWAGSYRVREVVPAGYGQTSPVGYSAQVTVAAGQAASAAAFGNVLISSVTMNLGYFLTLTRNFGQPGTFAAGDLNGDGTVNLADLLLLTRNFGHALPASAIAGATPEAPATIPARVVRRR